MRDLSVMARSAGKGRTDAARAAIMILPGEVEEKCGCCLLHVKALALEEESKRAVAQGEAE